MHSFLPTFLGGTFFSLLDVSKRNIFSGGRVVCARARSAQPPPPPPLRTRLVVTLTIPGTRLLPTKERSPFDILDCRCI